jgi:hypothetical protein
VKCAPWPEACHTNADNIEWILLPEHRMKPLFLVTVVTTILASACATSPRATSGPSPNVTPRDTTGADTTARDTTGRMPTDTSAVPLRALLER